MADFVGLNYESLLRELRCKNDNQHRIDAAKLLINNSDNPERITYLLNAVLYDPLPEVRKNIKSMLFELYGSELETILTVEGVDGIPVEDPWLIPCSITDINIINESSFQVYEDIESFVKQKDIDSLHDVLRDPLDTAHRLAAVHALIGCHNEESPEMLARSVIHDPDENIQQYAYQALYQIIGNQKTEALLEKIGVLAMDEDQEWLLVPDYFEEYQYSLQNQDRPLSLFGLNKTDQARGLISLYSRERNPQKRITIIDQLSQSNDINVNETIARIGLSDSDKVVREHAKLLLENRLGENLDEFLEHINHSYTSSGGEPDDDEYDELDMQELEEIERNSEFSSLLNSQEPVVTEGSAFNPMILIAGLVILALILFMILR